MMSKYIFVITGEQYLTRLKVQYVGSSMLVGNHYLLLQYI